MKAKTAQLWGAWLVMVLGLMGAGCGKSTYLVIHFTGMSLGDIYRIATTLTLTSADGGTSVGVVEYDHPDGSPPPLITLPASAAFVLDDHSGPLTIAASALNSQGMVVGTATKTTTIMQGKTWTIEMNLLPVTAASGAADATRTAPLN